MGFKFLMAMKMVRGRRKEKGGEKTAARITDDCFLLTN
jgi:hypothetical protein